VAAVTLRISPTFELPDSAVTSTFGILAVRGAGKSNTAAVMAEEMFAAGLPFVAIDPVGSWFGLRSSADGSSAGLAIPIFGGRRGDVPLGRDSGALLADLVVSKRLSCVVDLSEFDSEAAKKAFLLAFATRLYKTNELPLHLFLEEADDYIPQRPMRDETLLLRAWENIVRRGRARGIGITLVTQRSASVNKSVLTQVETLFAMRTTGPQDRAAIEEWVRYHAKGTDLVASLASLKDGEAWCWSPGWLGRMERVQVRRRRTFDSGATPKDVASARPAATLADVDLPSLSKAWEATLERTKADDPKLLRARIAELEREVKAKPAPSIPLLTTSKIGAGNRLYLEKLRDRIRLVSSEAQACSDDLATVLSIMERGISEGPKWECPPSPFTPRPEPLRGPRANAATTERVGAVNREPSPAPKTNGASAKLASGERKVLTALAQHGRCDKSKLAILTGYAVGGGGFGNILSALRTRGLIVGSGDVEITSAGAETLGPYEPLPDGAALMAWWEGHVGKAERLILRALRDKSGRASKEAIAVATGYEVTGGGFGNALSHLRTLELLSGRGELQLHPALMGGRS
jgi:hypothetical protein